MATVRTVYAGIDTGNKSAKVVLQVGKRAKERDRLKIAFPSDIGDGSMSELLRLRKKHSPAALAADEYVLEMDVDGRSFFVGRLAREQSKNATTSRGDATRYWSGPGRRLFVTGVAALLPDPLVEVYVVSSMPNRIWSLDADELVRQSLVGDWKFTFRGEPRRIIVRGSLSTMEGASAIGRLGDVPPAHRGVIDVGGGDTDLVVLTPELEAYMPGCRSTPLGIDSIGDRLNAVFLPRYGRELMPAELELLLTHHAAAMAPPVLYVDQEPISLAREFRDALLGVGEDISRFVKTEWATGPQGKVAGNLASVSFIGGGPSFFSPMIMKLIKKVLVPDDPIFETAQGNCDIAASLTADDWAELG